MILPGDFGTRVQKQNRIRRAAFQVWHPGALSKGLRRAKMVPGSCINSYVGGLRDVVGPSETVISFVRYVSTAICVPIREVVSAWIYLVSFIIVVAESNVPYLTTKSKQHHDASYHVLWSSRRLDCLQLRRVCIYLMFYSFLSSSSSCI